jgi:hypothetical protein
MALLIIKEVGKFGFLASTWDNSEDSLSFEALHYEASFVTATHLDFCSFLLLSFPFCSD